MTQRRRAKKAKRKSLIGSLLNDPDITGNETGIADDDGDVTTDGDPCRCGKTLGDHDTEGRIDGRCFGFVDALR